MRVREGSSRDTNGELTYRAAVLSKVKVPHLSEQETDVEESEEREKRERAKRARKETVRTAIADRKDVVCWWMGEGE